MAPLVRRRRLALPAALVVVLLATACGGDPDPETAPEPSASPSESESAGEPTESPSETTGETGDPEETEEPTGDPEETGGAGDLPVDLLDWKPVPGPVDDEVTVSGKWRLTRAADGSRASLRGPAGADYTPPRGFRYGDALIDGQFAVVVAQDQQETKPAVAEVVSLADGRESRIDRRSTPATTSGGSWTIGSGFLTHPTRSGDDYCLAVVDLLADRGRPGPCVPPRHGLTNVSVSPAGTSAMTFDDARPSCRTLNRVEGTRLVPLRGPTGCEGWDVVTTETAQVWSEVRDESRVEQAVFFADAGSGTVELGPGTSGTLTWCGDAAYFVRDPQRGDEPARLVRVRDGEAAVVYESPGTGNAFLSAPRCGGTDLTVTAFSQAGDEQVTAEVG